jgi:hypothetical protein
MEGKSSRSRVPALIMTGDRGMSMTIDYHLTKTTVELPGM